MHKLLILVIALLLTACGSTKYVPIESVRTEWRDRTVKEVVTDTVNNTRLVFIKGDTVIDVRNKEHVRTEYIRDTCVVERNDTIRIPYPVERELSRWERIKMDFGGMALGASLIALCFAVIWLVKKIKRK